MEPRRCLCREEVAGGSGAASLSSWILDSGAWNWKPNAGAWICDLVHSMLEVGQCARLAPIPSGGQVGWCG